MFDLFFRKCPFKGEFALFGGLQEALGLISHFKLSDEDVEFVRSIMPGIDPGYVEWLRGIDCSGIRVHALKEGSACFPAVPLLRLEGPLAIVQLLETPLLCLVNYATLMTTNAARIVKAAGPGKSLLEFGLRRAQGPDGAMSASRYAYAGGFHGTSNVLAAKMLGIPVKGTHAHSFVTSFTGLDDLTVRGTGTTVKAEDGTEHDLAAQAQACLAELGFGATNEGELAAFVAYCRSYPKVCLCLVDTYDTLRSGVPNFLAVALALHRLGHKAVGIRLDSGDLAGLSVSARAMFVAAGEKIGDASFDPAKFVIVASNDINEKTLAALNAQGHEINTYGIGTHLVTCQAQPALGGVFKLVEINGNPRIKLSQDIGKVTLPGRKQAFRLYGKDGAPILDLLAEAGAPPPEVGLRVLCKHRSDAKKRCYVTPSRVELLHHLVWADGKLQAELPSLHAIRTYAQEQLALMPAACTSLSSPETYKVAVTEQLHTGLHDLWSKESSIRELE